MLNSNHEPAKLSLREQFGRTLVELGKENENIVVLDADLSSSTRTSYFKKEFPERFFNMGIAEQNMLGTAMGLAAAGKIAFVSGFTCFTLGRAWELIKIASMDKLSLKICPTHAGLSAALDGGTHQSLEDLSLMASISDLKIYCPCDPQELDYILKQTLLDEGPSYIRLSRNNLPWVWNDNYLVRKIPHENDYIEKIYESDSSVSEMTIFTTGSTTCHMPKLISMLEKDGTPVRLFHVGRIKPLNKEKIWKIVEKTEKIITIEEHNIIAGFGAQLSRIICEKYPKRILTLGVNDRFGQTGNYEKLLKEYHLDPESLFEKIRLF